MRPLSVFLVIHQLCSNHTDGTIIDNGLKFRNEFHLDPLSSADVFVPCGGRPEAVDLSNVQTLLNGDGTPRFKYIVEGANLFFTQEARLRLEKAGAVIFKDASANKGGVTSSSLEVLAALAFTDDEFQDQMMVKNNVAPAFYTDYVKAVHGIIEKNAELEFEALWRESERTKKPKSILSDELSFAIVRLNRELQTTTLWDNVPLRRIVLNEAFPRILLEKVGLDTLLKRVPESYVKAIFGSYLASRFGMFFILLTGQCTSMVLNLRNSPFSNSWHPTLLRYYNKCVRVIQDHGSALCNELIMSS